MKPIGIGQLKKANPKAMSRHEFEEDKNPAQKDAGLEVTQSPVLDKKPIALEHVIIPQGDEKKEDQEGQLSVDVYQTDSELMIVAPVAGTPPDQLHVSITDDVITIKGRRELPFKNSATEENAYLKECFWGNFSRSLILPAAVDLNHVEARFKNNVLTIRVPKTERVRTRVIRIDNAEM